MESAAVEPPASRCCHCTAAASLPEASFPSSLLVWSTAARSCQRCEAAERTLDGEDRCGKWGGRESERCHWLYPANGLTITDRESSELDDAESRNKLKVTNVGGPHRVPE